VAVGALEEEGQMVLVDGTLVAVLVHLTCRYDNPHLQGKWFVEAGLGPLSEKGECFSTIEEAEEWVLQLYLAERYRGSGRILPSRQSLRP
jgi:urocanate hydratase